jgi:hypothetical protein
MPAPENNTIITPDSQPEDIQQATAAKKVAQLDATSPNPIAQISKEAAAEQEHKLLVAQLSEDNSNKELLGLATDEQKVLKFIKLHNPNDKFFINWNNIFTLGELYYSNYTSEEYRTYLNKLKLLTAKYYNPKKYYLVFDNKQIRAFAKSTPAKKQGEDTHPDTNDRPLDSLDKPTFRDAQNEMKTGYTPISQMRSQLEVTYKFLSNMPYVEPADKKKFIKLRNKFIKDINAYYVHMYYFNRINNFVMTEREITLPQMNMAYSELTNEMLPKIDKVKIRLSDDVINQKYNNEAAKLELYLAIKQKLQEQQANPKDKKINDELRSMMKEYLEFDKLYQAKLVNYINQRKSKKIITDLVIIDGQPLPGDGAITNPSEGMDDLMPSTTNLSALGYVAKKQTGGGKSAGLYDMDEKDRNRKFFFINKALRARGDF